MQKKRRKGGLMSLLALVMVLSMVATTVAFAEPDEGETSNTGAATEQESSKKDDDGAEEVDLQKLIIALSAPEVEKVKDEEPEEVTVPQTEVAEPDEDEESSSEETTEKEEKPAAVTEPQDEETEAPEDEEPASEPVKNTQPSTKTEEEKKPANTNGGKARPATEAVPAEEEPAEEEPAEEEPAEETTVEETPETEAPEAGLDAVGFVPVLKTGKTNLTVKCGWIDSQDQDGMRPGTVYMTVYANGVPVKVVCVTENDGWQLTVTDLNEYDANGNRIQYSVSCSTVKGYLTKIVGCIAYHFRSPEKVDICGVKVWDDANDADGIRPGSITVRLYAFGKYATSRTVTAETGWRYCFKDCPKYCYGTLIDYSISEDAIDGYTTSINEYDIINTHVPEETTAPVEETTAPVEETTAPVEETTAPAEETTAPVEETTAPVEETTEAPEESTPGVEESKGPNETTAPDESTSAPQETTETPKESTTAPKESTTESPSKPTNPGKSVKTGDNTKMVIWFAIMVVSVAAIATVLVLRRRRG